MNNVDYQKTCTICRVLKNGSEFRNDKRLKSGKGSACLVCIRKQALERRNKDVQKARDAYTNWAANNETYNSYRKLLWAKNNPEKARLSDKKSYAKNKEKRKEVSLSWRKKNIKYLQEKAKKWRINNTEYVLSKNAERRAAKLNRTPGWLTKEDKLKIQGIYKKARELTKQTGVLYHVDHVIPLQGKLVSGLHVPNNLQILHWKDNLSKRHKYTP